MKIMSQEGVYSIPVMILSTFCVFFNPFNSHNPVTVGGGGGITVNHHYFIDKGTEAFLGLLICPGSHTGSKWQIWKQSDFR